MSKYSVVSLQYQQMMGQLRPILKHNAVFPKVRFAASLVVSIS